MLYSEQYFKKQGLYSIYEKILSHERISNEEALVLFEHPDINAIGALAHAVRLQKHGYNTYYSRNIHINYSNVCVHQCAFCAFKRRTLEEDGAFEYSLDEIEKQLRAANASFTEIHIVGGCHPTLSLQWFVELVSMIKAFAPEAGIKIFTAVEIAHLAKKERISIEEVLTQLRNAGASMLTGGGAEIFSHAIRKQLCPTKLTAEEWLHVHDTAHSLGYTTNCTMLFGHIETLQDRVEHLDALRLQQDASHGFTCFIPLTYQDENNVLSTTRHITKTSFLDQLKTIAIARLMLDNIPHIKAYWVMLGVKEAQTALYYGANDLDGTIIEEKIAHWAGARSSSALTAAELEYMIRDAGFTPVCRDAMFTHT